MILFQQKMYTSTCLNFCHRLEGVSPMDSERPALADQ